MASNASDNIGKRLYVARSKRNLTMAELAAKAGMSASGINHIEKGHSCPSANIIENLARSLDVDPCWLAYGTGEKPDWLRKPE